VKNEERLRVSEIERQLIQVLVDRGIITKGQAELAYQEEVRSGRPMLKVLLERNMLPEKELVRAQALVAGLWFTDVSVEGPDAAALELVPVEIARRQMVLPMRVTEDDKLVVAMAEPRNHLAVDQVAKVSGKEVVANAAHRADLLSAVSRYYGAPAAVDPTLAPPAADPTPDRSPLDTPPPVNAPVEPVPEMVAAPQREMKMANGSGMPGSVDTAFGPDDIPMVEAPPIDAPVVEEVVEEREPNLANFLLEVVDRNASDLHLTAGLPPMVRIHGELQPIKGYRRLLPKDLQELMYAILTQKQRERFEEELELDVSYSLPGKARFRVNVFQQRDAMGAVMRLIPFEIKHPDDLGLPAAVKEFTKLRRGLVLVTGITGSGKSTTLAGLIDMINEARTDHIMTVEDPIEFLHRHKRCVINQREVGTDTYSFSNALKHVLRQDPDVILVGEMRDLETIHMALTAAETGHLVFGTLHTQDAPQSVDRVIDVFPPHQQQQIRVQLAGTIAGVVSQQLLPVPDGKGRVVAVEVLVATPAVRNLIREGKTHQIYTSMQAGGKYGMQVMDQHLAQLVKQGKITYEIGLEHSHHVDEFNRMTGRG
jgi:twitching motility protein PilT